ncbi:MAG: PDK repeat-containing protein [Bacteroidetes bacterium]|nr:MAG: PDK repeat-containing protein [Bacteroidota bacterium]
MMKKLLFVPAMLATLGASAQNDTLLFSDFNTDPSVYMQIGISPPGNSNDQSWYSYDVDQLPDGSPSGRPGEWFWTQAYAPSDTLTAQGVMGSNSWTNDGVNRVENYLVTAAVQIVDNQATLHWKSAPYQTPRYLDGYKVLVSTTINDVSSFSDTLFVAGEYASLDNGNLPNSYGSYTFDPAATVNPMAPFIHGMDGTYTEFDPTSDSSRLLGVLRPLTVSLAQYAGQTIYICFLHNDIDDNLISVDDVLVLGTAPNGIAENNNVFEFDVYPNPASDMITVKYDLPSASDVVFSIYDVTGKLVRSENLGQQASGMQSQKVSISELAAGVYQARLQTSAGTVNTRIVKN